MRSDIYTIDIETRSSITGDGETIPWMGEIIGLGLCWGDTFDTHTAYYSGDGIAEIIHWLSTEQIPLVAYNTLFEKSWLDYHFSEYPLNLMGDAALYAIALDNSASSFGLKDSATRLVTYEPYELEYKAYCVEQFTVKASDWGSKIPHMPYELISTYCRHDVLATYMIWQRGVAELQIDAVHEFFMAEVFLTSEAFIKGTLIDREKAIGLYYQYRDAYLSADKEFMANPELAPFIEESNQKRYEKKCAQDLAKSKTGKVRPPAYEKWIEKHPFKTSTAQLAEVFKAQKLFWNPSKLIHEWPELTEGGSPCLDSDHIHLYGTGGQILANAGMNKSKAYKLKHIVNGSDHDNRCHFDINLCSVRSTRVSSNGLNIVATPLGSDVGECFIADEGWSHVITDFCLHPKVEYLTKRGWVPILKLSSCDEVWQVNPITLEGSWCKPLRIIKRHFEGKMYHYISGGGRGGLSVTENHKMLWVGQQKHERADKRKYRCLKLAQDYQELNHGCNFAHFSDQLDDKPLIEEHLIWLACALQADGSWIRENEYRIQVSEPRKVQKMVELTEKFGVVSRVAEVREGQNNKVHFFHFRFYSELLEQGKDKLLNLKTLPNKQAAVFCEALSFWDGSYERREECETGRFYYYSTEETNIETVQIWLVQNGYEAKKKECYEGSDRHKKCYSLSIKEKGTTRFAYRASLSSCEIQEEDYVGEVGCVTVDEGFILVRQEGQTFVTGNCQLEPTVAAILSGDSMLQYCAYHGAGHVPAWKDGVLHVDDTYLCLLSKTKRWSEEIREGFNAEEWMDSPGAVKKKFYVLRQAGKKIFLMTQYGSGVATAVASIYKELGLKISVAEGHQLINTMWAVFPDLYRYICRLKNAAAQGKNLYTWLGFPITTNDRIMHCVFNYRAQTEAAHVMKQMLWQMWSRKADWWIPSVSNIHDASGFLVQTTKVPEFDMLLNESLHDLNVNLAPLTKGIKFRIETHVGKNLREAKEG